MATPNIFPQYYNCFDRGTWTHSPPLAQSIWMRIRKTVAPGMTWYAVSMEITSRDSLTLYVYDMRDMVTGGIGDQIFKCDVSRSTLQNLEVAALDMLLDEACERYAESELDRRELAARKRKIAAVRKELFGR